MAAIYTRRGEQNAATQYETCPHVQKCCACATCDRVLEKAYSERNQQSQLVPVQWRELLVSDRSVVRDGQRVPEQVIVNGPRLSILYL